MKIDKEFCENLSKVEGEIRGAVFLTDKDYILSKKGEIGITKIVDRAADLGFDIDYKKIERMEWYPLGTRLISFALVADEFGWDKQVIREMGYFAPKINVMVKYSLKFFSSLDRMASRAGLFWKQNYTIGNLEVVEADHEKGRFVIHLTDFYRHFANVDEEFTMLFVEEYLEKYFEKVTSLVAPQVKGEMKKITSNEKIAYEFAGTWKVHQG